jgi:hypothetical protein
MVSRVFITNVVYEIVNIKNCFYYIYIHRLTL